MLLVERVHLLAQALRLFLVLLAQFLELRGHETLLRLDPSRRPQLPLEDREQNGPDADGQHHHGKTEGADRLQRPDGRKEVDQLLEHPLERSLEDREDRERVEIRDHHAGLPAWVVSR